MTTFHQPELDPPDAIILIDSANLARAIDMMDELRKATKTTVRAIPPESAATWGARYKSVFCQSTLSADDKKQANLLLLNDGKIIEF